MISVVLAKKKRLLNVSGSLDEPKVKRDDLRQSPRSSDRRRVGTKTNHFRIYLSFTLCTAAGRWRPRCHASTPTFAIQTGEAGDQTADLVTNGQAAPPPEERPSTRGTHLAGQLLRVPTLQAWRAAEPKDRVNKHQRGRLLFVTGRRLRSCSLRERISIPCKN